MPYICTDGNRYICEHDCHNEHYGDMTRVRECCVKDAAHAKSLVLRNALTTAHPAYLAFTAAWNSLTTAEQSIVGGIVAAPGWANGFVEL